MKRMKAERSLINFGEVNTSNGKFILDKALEIDFSKDIEIVVSLPAGAGVLNHKFMKEKFNKNMGEWESLATPVQFDPDDELFNVLFNVEESESEGYYFTFTIYNSEYSFSRFAGTTIEIYQ